MKIVYQSSVNTLVIDQTTARILELIINSSNPKSSDTLFGTINRTKTKSGYILLRANILQVSTERGEGAKCLTQPTRFTTTTTITAVADVFRVCRVCNKPTSSQVDLATAGTAVVAGNLINVTYCAQKL